MPINPQALNSQIKEKIELDDKGLRVILDEFDIPCVLINYRTKRIVAINDKLAVFSKFPVTEIQGNDIESLIKDVSIDNIQDGFIGSFSLIRKDGLRSSITIEYKYIDQTQHIALIKFLPDQTNSLNKDFWVLFNKEKQNLLSDLPNLNRDQFIQELLSIGEKIFDADICLLYQTMGEESDFEKTSSGNDDYPQKILFLELKRISGIDHWAPGKRVLTELHRACRNSKAKHLFTFPINFSSGSKGLYISAFKADLDVGQTKMRMSIFQDWVQIIETQFFRLLEINNSNLHLKKRNQELEFILENISDSVLILNQNNVISDFNSEFCRLFKYSPVEIMNSPVGRIFNLEDYENSSLIKEGDDIDARKRILFLHDRTGNEIPAFLDMHDVKIDDCVYRFLIIRNASDYLSQTKNRLDLERKAVLGETIAEFAHEVRNPINNIATGLQLVDQKLDGEDENKETVKRMREDCVRMNYLIESILTFSRQKLDNFRDIDLISLISRAIFRMKNKVEKAGHSIQYMCDLEKAVVNIDQRAIEQVINNFISNSLEALDKPGGIISISLKDSEKGSGSFEMIIADTGLGIPLEVEKRLFEPFATGKPKGTGLGLAISKRIIENHNGSIEVNTFPGGTIFRIFLPQAIRGENN